MRGVPVTPASSPTISQTASQPYLSSFCGDLAIAVDIQEPAHTGLYEAFLIRQHLLDDPLAHFTAECLVPEHPILERLYRRVLHVDDLPALLGLLHQTK